VVLEEMIFIFIFGTSIIIFNTVKEEKLVRPMSMYVLMMVAIASIKYNEVAEGVSLVYTTVQKTLINLL